MPAACSAPRAGRSRRSSTGSPPRTRRAHRVDERAAELAVLRRGAKRPAHRVDDAVERLRDAPDLLHAKGPDLRALAPEREAVDRDARQMALCALGEDGHAREDVGARLEI